MESITQLEQYIQQRLEKSKGMNLIGIIESRLKKINNIGNDNARIFKALEASRKVMLHLAEHYGERNEKIR